MKIVYDALFDVCRNRNIVRCKHLIKSRSIYHNANAFRVVCLTGYLELAQWMAGKWPRINIHGRNNRAFRDACANGDLHMAQWISSYKNFNLTRNQYHNLFCRVSGTGHIDILQWMISRFLIAESSTQFLHRSILFDNYRAVLSAADADQLHVIIWFDESGIDYNEYTFDQVLSSSCRNNNFDMVAFCRAKCPTSQPNHYIIGEICKAGHLEMIKYIIQNFGTAILLNNIHRILIGLDKYVDVRMDIIEFLLSFVKIDELPRNIPCYYIYRCQSIIPVIINYFDIDEMKIHTYQDSFDADIAKTRSMSNKSARKI